MASHSNHSCDSDRRRWMVAVGVSTFGLALGPPFARAAQGGPTQEHGEEMAVTAAEDLMREHGVLRRALLVYSEAAARLTQGRDEVPASALGQMADLFRRFGEDYHERSLEEAHVFPALIKGGGRNAVLAKTLISQHERGREITDFIAASTRGGHIASGAAAPLAATLTDFVRMYQHHAAIEDTVIFPAWKQGITPARYRELSEEFEELEHKLFGEDGYDDAVKQVAEAERAFGLADLSALTAPKPPGISAPTAPPSVD
ncbi:hemerythrin domain-containing protein [Luteimonas soli]|uniref:Hemerythrin domain-containing protein n=1 Tax=Luteimonas soli TaxID=1648966 RepID=A0ABV7XJ67_9GAMM